MTKKNNTLRLCAEELYKDELESLIKNEKYPVPTGWKMSPRSVLTYIVGGKVGRKTITPKYIGHKRLVEIAIATLVTDRALLLIGEPGTGKSWLSEHLAAAIAGDSRKVIQGTAGTTEEQIRYSWNYALLISKGPSERSLIRSPIFRAMEEGSLARFEEITRCAPEVQDAMISILSEKNISIPELAKEVNAQKGFSIIATANTRDKGVNDMSAALKRRFNTIILPSPENVETEMSIVTKRVEELSRNFDLSAAIPGPDLVEKVVTVLRELRLGVTTDRQKKVKSPSGGLSTAEAISLLGNAMSLAGNFGTGKVSDHDLASGLSGAVIKDEEKDKIIWKQYLDTIMKNRGTKWNSLYDACMEQLS